MIDVSLLIVNLLNPPILFFFLGMLAVAIKSDLVIPQPIPRFLSLYLLFALGFQGGVELNHSGITTQVILILLAATISAIVIPIYTFYILKARFSIYDAGAIAASYGSVSAVTFITAISLLKLLNISYGGYMIAALALMETPAIIIGVLLIRLYAQEEGKLAWKTLLHDAACNGAVILILGSLIIGLLTGQEGMNALKPFSNDIFKGMLSFFLLDMGLVAAKRMRALWGKSYIVIAFAIVIPLINALCGIAFAYAVHLNSGDALLFTILCASASYIAVPAAMRIAVPEANPGFYIPMALGITFPFNVAIGLPLYLSLIQRLWG